VRAFVDFAAPRLRKHFKVLGSITGPD
jgi:hypothetical protein